MTYRLQRDERDEEPVYCWANEKSLCRYPAEIRGLESIYNHVI